jgi:hypothetical protein
MADITFAFGDFNTTTVKVAAVSDKGREFLGSVFGAACIGVELPKSKAEDFAVFAERRGVAYQGVSA